MAYGDQFRVLLWLKPTSANAKRLWNGMGPELRFKKWLAAVLMLTGFPCAVVGMILLFEYASSPGGSNLWITAVALMGGGLLAALIGNAVWFSAKKSFEGQRAL